jgi:hypothetical protein
MVNQLFYLSKPFLYTLLIKFDKKIIQIINKITKREKCKLLQTKNQKETRIHKISQLFVVVVVVVFFFTISQLLPIYQEEVFYLQMKQQKKSI